MASADGQLKRRLRQHTAIIYSCDDSLPDEKDVRRDGRGRKGSKETAPSWQNANAGETGWRRTSSRLQSKTWSRLVLEGGGAGAEAAGDGEQRSVHTTARVAGNADAADQEAKRQAPPSKANFSDEEATEDDESYEEEPSLHTTGSSATEAGFYAHSEDEDFFVRAHSQLSTQSRHRYNLRRRRLDEHAPDTDECIRLRKQARYNFRPNRGIAVQPGVMVPWSDVDLDAETAPAAAAANHRSDLYVPISSPGTEAPLGFDRIAGMATCIRKLKEMVVLPLLYPQILSRLGLRPPRGVLFHGPPGTGKTLMARILADSCSRMLQASGSDKRVAFFLRNGSDCLSKWIGEAERHLRTLFQEAKAKQPAIIFFDELDGLAPDRGAKGGVSPDQSHISLVATLLALMDGLDDRGQVVVVGATNRVDALDPALRRPGRFDREFYFPLPEAKARRDILAINTASWWPGGGASGSLLDVLAEKTEGWSGADLKGLCTEAALNAVHRTHPSIYEDNTAIVDNLTGDDLAVLEADFNEALLSMTPSTQRRVDRRLLKGLPFGIEQLFDPQLLVLQTRIRSSIRTCPGGVLVWPRLAICIASDLEAADLALFIRRAIAPFLEGGADRLPFRLLADFDEVEASTPCIVLASDASSEQVPVLKAEWSSTITLGQPAILLIHCADKSSSVADILVDSRAIPGDLANDLLRKHGCPAFSYDGDAGHVCLDAVFERLVLSSDAMAVATRFQGNAGVSEEVPLEDASILQRIAANHVLPQNDENTLAGVGEDGAILGHKSRRGLRGVPSMIANPAHAESVLVTSDSFI